MANDQAEPYGGGRILKIAGLSKHFGGVQALENVSIEVRAGTTHALVGENGAGKSTLIKILSGNLRPDRGVITFKGQEFAPRSPAQARSSGVSVIYQELTVIPHLSVAENIYLGALPTAPFGFVDRRRMMDGARAMIDRLGLDIDLTVRPANWLLGFSRWSRSRRVWRRGPIY